MIIVVTWSPPDVAERRWDFNPGRTMSPEMEACEKVTGLPWPRFVEAATVEQQTQAKRALLWILRKRDEPTLRFSEVEFAFEDLRLDLDDASRSDAIDAIRAQLDGDVDDASRAELEAGLAQLEAEQARAGAGEETPKAFEVASLS